MNTNDTINKGSALVKEAVVDKRTSNRKSIIMDVMIGYRHLGLVKAEVLNISLGGICLDTQKHRLPTQVGVTLHFKIDAGQFVYDCEAHAIVMRQEGSTCCFMFDGMSEQTHQALRSLVGDWHIPSVTDYDQPMVL